VPGGGEEGKWIPSEFELGCSSCGEREVRGERGSSERCLAQKYFESDLEMWKRGLPGVVGIVQG